MSKWTVGAVGAVFGPFFYNLYFPYSVHVYRTLLGIPVTVTPPVGTLELYGLQASTVIEMTAIPAALVGALGLLLAARMLNGRLLALSLNNPGQTSSILEVRFSHPGSLFPGLDTFYHRCLGESHGR